MVLWYSAPQTSLLWFAVQGIRVWFRLLKSFISLNSSGKVRSNMLAKQFVVPKHLFLKVETYCRPICKLPTSIHPSIHCLPLAWGRVAVAAASVGYCNSPGIAMFSNCSSGGPEVSSPGSPPVGHAPKNLTRDAPRRHPNQMPKPPQLAPFDSMDLLRAPHRCLSVSPCH